jgi:hypothetical protein
MPADPQHFPVKLTQAQRKVVAEFAPELADRLKLHEQNQRAIRFTLAELRAVKEEAGKAVRQAGTGMVRNSLRHVTDLMAQALDRSGGLGAVPDAGRVYQFRVTLLDIRPPICTICATAAVQFGRRYHGIEASAAYRKIAERRIAAYGQARTTCTSTTSVSS